MGSSPTPCPSGSIQCIPDVNVGSDARSSRHVLGNETLLPTEFCPIAEPMSLLLRVDNFFQSSHLQFELLQTSAFGSERCVFGCQKVFYLDLEIQLLEQLFMYKYV